MTAILMLTIQPSRYANWSSGGRLRANQLKNDMTTLLQRPEPAAVAPTPPPPKIESGWVGQLITVAIVFGPMVGLALAMFRLWGHGLGVRDAALAVVFYFGVGHGVAMGFHRLFAHRSFVANRPLKVLLAIAGSMALEGGLIPWVENHRLHHTYSDRRGDPHSPLEFGSSRGARIRGLWHAHMGWLFAAQPVDQGRQALDLRRDRDLAVISRLFPVWCLLSLALPFGFGWALGGTLAAGATALLWAGAVRIFVLHHVTWSINSLCHMFGKRPFETQDHSTNLALLSVMSFGESWHNAHHAFPRSARHGLLPRQLDSSATLIRACERAGWVHEVHWTKRPARHR
jgi:stearoyl-CoA desaturase (delta-9 desaturase)